MLPFAVQFVHSFEHHSHDVCTVSDLHIDKHKFDCSVFHFKINQNSIEFSSEIVITEHFISDKIIISSEAQLASISTTYKASRAPPTLLF
ncbi:hypothetical protein [Lutibacter citreus]|uniref:hypothetical protein n=1 Tax=Lutibacter citreus TaxID=2138210 RepID=UPI000DBE8836|nr:hypothetical protein [Lutibacter citreus]